jgi:hypothetical protein
MVAFKSTSPEHGQINIEPPLDCLERKPTKLRDPAQSKPGSSRWPGMKLGGCLLIVRVATGMKTA